MNSSKIIMTSGTWSSPSEFKTDREFAQYFNAVDMATQTTICLAGVPQAQRLLALRYQTEKNKPLSELWWNTAARNKDPLALVHRAESLCAAGKLDEAEKDINLAFDQVKASSDQELLSSIEADQERILMNIGQAYYQQGKDFLEQRKLPEAQQAFKKTYELSHDIFSLVYLSKAYFLDANYSQAIYWAELTLHLSTQADPRVDKQALRALAHNLIGSALGYLDKSDDFANVLRIAAHHRKAQAYQPNVSIYEVQFETLLNKRVQDDMVRNLILVDTICKINLTHGIAQTEAEQLETLLLNPEELVDWISYPAPSAPSPTHSTDRDASSETRTSPFSMFSASRAGSPSSNVGNTAPSPSPTEDMWASFTNKFKEEKPSATTISFNK